MSVQIAFVCLPAPLILPHIGQIAGSDEILEQIQLMDITHIACDDGIFLPCHTRILNRSVQNVYFLAGKERVKIDVIFLLEFSDVPCYRSGKELTLL